MTDITLRVTARDEVWAGIARRYFTALIELRRAIDQSDGPAAARAAKALERYSDQGATLAAMEKGDATDPILSDTALDRAAAAARAEFTRAWGPEVPDDLWHRVSREVIGALVGGEVR
ncbi:hypothetical protein [Zavarzinia aquatilis]|uniref:Uncharacterized protein n=1 Tax=Zavarzinia aquatilis TaxID=2211142 RepID=A0A317EEJ8_9PROT|nr:hypothetical protein [Zavarzinia aquatilis]PWR24540.1 hypothetical protein DKG74_06970 [Zavarzinia aquatilis]